MKAKVIGILALALLVAAPISARDHQHVRTHKGSHDFNFRTFRSWETNDAQWRLKNDGILVTNIEDKDEKVWITEDGELFVNDQQVRLQPGQQVELKAFRDQTYELVDDAKAIAHEGVRIGLKGAGIGLKAIGGVFKMILSDYSEDDLERDMDAEAAKLEVWADALEKKAEVLEDKADKLEELGLKLKEEIPELRNLDWLN